MNDILIGCTVLLLCGLLVYLHRNRNVVLFGADRRGFLDSTPALERAMKTMPKNGSLIFPSGTYKLGKVLNVYPTTTRFKIRKP